MSKEELQSYRLSSMEEPTDEMLEAIMLQVQESARLSLSNAQKELDRRFEELCKRIADRNSQVARP